MIYYVLYNAIHSILCIIYNQRRQMSKIAFRAWEIKTSVMHKVLSLCFGFPFQYRVVVQHDKDACGVHNLFGNECKVMQYTGINDKNGKEIYEGDIVNNHSLITYQVIWNSYRLCWAVTEDRINSFPMIASKKYEVIGNIYENKELLEEDNNG